MSGDCFDVKGNTFLWNNYFSKVVHSCFYTVCVAVEILKAYTDVSMLVLLLLIFVICNDEAADSKYEILWGSACVVVEIRVSDDSRLILML